MIENKLKQSSNSYSAKHYKVQDLIPQALWLENQVDVL